MKLSKESPYTKLLFREPREPRLPAGYAKAEKRFDKGDNRNLNFSERRAEKEMNEARKRLEKKNFEDSLVGKAKEKARDKRLDDKHRKERFMKKLKNK